MPDETWMILYIGAFEGLRNVDKQTKGNKRAKDNGKEHVSEALKA